MSSAPLPVTAIAAQGDLVVVASGSTLHAYNTSDSSITSSSPSSSSSTSNLIRQIAISPDSQYIASIADDKSLKIHKSKSLELLSSRQTSKKCSSVSWTSSNDILVSDKVGDTYRYPLTPRPKPKEALTSTALSSDPSKNPDADLVLGHVSIITCHVLTPDGKRIITSDRDEHIRISRYPDAFVIDKYLFGTNGFCSALHIPQSRGELLLSAGGENSLRIWDWKEGVQVGQVGIMEAVLPYRRARSTMRKVKKARKVRPDEVGDGFYDAPEGWMLPSGQGVCVQKIDSVVVGDNTVALFNSEGATALHSFVLPSDLSTSPAISTLPLPHPILDFQPIPNRQGQIMVSLDPGFGIVRDNQTIPPFKAPQSITEDQAASLTKLLVIVEVKADGSMEIIDSDLLEPLQKALTDSSRFVPLKTLSQLSLYNNLSLYPRWPGFEEDDELAGTNEDPSSVIPDQPSGSTSSPVPPNIAHSEAGTVALNLSKKDWTREELEQLGPRQLGRLKAIGVDVGDLLSRKKMKRAAVARREAAEAQAREAGLPSPGQNEPSKRQKKREEKAKLVEEKSKEEQIGNDEEASMNVE